jgi:hypothetical protein
LVAEHQSVYASPVRLFAVPDPVPGVYVVGRSRVSGEPQSYVDLQDPGFDPASEVIVDGGERLQAPAFRGGVEVQLRRSDTLVVVTEASDPAYLVVVERHDSGWHARVDGAEVPVLRANVLFRAVRVPPGRHRVEMAYRTPGLRAGLALAALGVALAGAALRRGGARA